MHARPFSPLIRLSLIILFAIPHYLSATPPLAPESADEMQKESGLYRFEGCKLSPVDWADGDSFLVELKSGQKITVRLYGVDCFESTIRDATDASRLRSQRRWFGIVKETPQASMQLARELGDRATERVQELLSKPFTVITAFADGRGDPQFERFYGFVTLDDERDLGAVLVEEGWARAYGVYRSTWGGTSRDEYAESLRDLELTAASRRRGAWAYTVWESLAEERRLERADDAELSMSGPLLDHSINPNTASRDVLQSLPGIGEVIANRIIEARGDSPFLKVEDLRRVHGIGKTLLQKISPYLVFD